MKSLKELVAFNYNLSLFKEEVFEAVAPTDIDKILGKYLSRVKDPNAKSDFLMQAAKFLGRQSSVNPEDLDTVLRQHYAKNFDPAKLARGQTPVQKVPQGSVTPPPLPQQKPQFQSAGTSLPSLSKLASQETDPTWKKHNLPPPSALGQKPDPKEKDIPSSANDDKEDDIPMAKSSDFRSVPQKKAASTSKAEPKEKEVDMDKFGQKKTGKEKPVKSEPSPSAKEKQKKEPSKQKSPPKDEDDKEEKPSPAPDSSTKKDGNEDSEDTFDSLVKRGTGSTKSIQPPKKLAIGTTIDRGNLKGLKVLKKAGDWYVLSKGDKKYMYNPNEPFKGIKRLP